MVGKVARGGKALGFRVKGQKPQEEGKEVEKGGPMGVKPTQRRGVDPKVMGRCFLQMGGAEGGKTWVSGAAGGGAQHKWLLFSWWGGVEVTG
jgi:hypothetical protein